MKRKYLIGLVALSATLGIVGSGFSSWYFGHSDLTTATAGISTHVTDMVEGIGTLTDNNANQKLAIVLDQGGYKNKSDATKGISIVDTTNISDINDTTIASAPTLDCFSATYKIGVEDVNKLVNAGITSAQFIAHISFNTQDVKDVRTYIDFRSDYVTNNLKDATYTMFDNGILYYFKTIDFTLNSPIDQTFKFATKTSDDKVNDMLTYASKPTTKDTYDTMKSALSNKDILTVQYTIQIYTNN